MSLAALWFFQFIPSLLIPLFLVGCGRFMMQEKYGINVAFGYKSRLAQKNENTWQFANAYCGKLFFRYGISAAAAAVLIYPFFWRTASVVTVGTVFLVFQVVAIAVVVVFTERALKKAFNEDGTRRPA